MIPIRVKGRGLIPRGYGIAPRLTPFPADLLLIQTIMSTPGLTVEYVDPVTSRSTTLTRNNFQRIYNNYKKGSSGNQTNKLSTTPVQNPNPITPGTPVIPVAVVVDDEKKIEVPEVDASIKIDDDTSIRPIVKPETSAIPPSAVNSNRPSTPPPHGNHNNKDLNQNKSKPNQ